MYSFGRFGLGRTPVAATASSGRAFCCRVQRNLFAPHFQEGVDWEAKKHPAPNINLPFSRQRSTGYENSSAILCSL
jgi:hypothetical protein